MSTLSKRRALRIWFGLVLAYLVAAGVATLAFGEPREFLAFSGLPVLVAAYALHQLRLPGLLQHGGHCGWGPCEPTAAGWVAGVIFIAAVFWLLALVLAWAWERIGSRSSATSGPLP